MSAIDIIKKRRSIRRYSSRPIEFSKLIDILEAGLHAPSSGNHQSWKFVVVNDLKTKQKIAKECKGQEWISHAPVLIMVYAGTREQKTFYAGRGEILYSAQNCAAATQNMMLAATELGLGTCWIGQFNEDIIDDILKVEAKYGVLLHAIITLGYADEEPEVKSFAPFDQTVFFNKYGEKIKNPNLRKQDYAKIIGAQKVFYKTFAPVIQDKIKKFFERIINNRKKTSDKNQENIEKKVEQEIKEELNNSKKKRLS
jgi:nitroreductase